MRDDNTRTDFLGRRALQLHEAVAEHRLVQEGVGQLDLPASSPPPAPDIDEIRVLSEAGREAAHIVSVPSLLDLTYERRNRPLIHALDPTPGTCPGHLRHFETSSKAVQSTLRAVGAAAKLSLGRGVGWPQSLGVRPRLTVLSSPFV